MPPVLVPIFGVAVLAVQRKYPGPSTMRLRNLMLGGVYVDEVYIYPFPVTAA
jgi:hypothetical protein